MAEPADPVTSPQDPSGPTPHNPRAGRSPIRRAPFRAWLISGPVGRLVGFILDLARELWHLIRS